MKRERDHRSECGGCGTEDRYLLHNVRQRSTYRRFCTNCLLKENPGLFCPFCFSVYDDTPVDRAMCLKCPSLAHTSCIPTSYPSPHPNFVCPSCSSSNPNFSFFNLKVKGNNSGGSSEAKSNGVFRVIDKESARVLVAAAKIAAICMTKAASSARAEAEKRVKEAAVAKKRAKEALERLSFLAAKEKNNNNDDAHNVIVGLEDRKGVSNANGGANANASNKESNGVYLGSPPPSLLSTPNFGVQKTEK